MDRVRRSSISPSLALLPRPALLFALPSGGDADAEGTAEGATATLRFGGGRAFRPRDDVASLPAQIPAVGERAQVAEIVCDAARLPAAMLSAIGANRRTIQNRPWRGAAGGRLARSRLWSHRRGLEARPSPEGLSRMRSAWPTSAWRDPTSPTCASSTASTGSGPICSSVAPRPKRGALERGRARATAFRRGRWRRRRRPPPAISSRSRSRCHTSIVRSSCALDARRDERVIAVDARSAAAIRGHADRVPADRSIDSSSTSPTGMTLRSTSPASGRGSPSRKSSSRRRAAITRSRRSARGDSAR